jgi:hypothetical protein
MVYRPETAAALKKPVAALFKNRKRMIRSSGRRDKVRGA